ncbi:MAG: hypothetical protein ACI8X5_001517 [Planctomycetota bacterium]|jgi:uncharacterized protein (DUF58 family)
MQVLAPDCLALLKTAKQRIGPTVKSRSKSLDPAVLDALSHLSLVARTVVEGLQAGVHRSPHRGSSVEFQQHREYVPGDELRHIDWKVFAKSERLVVKEFVEETNLALHLMVDASESMNYGSLGWTKFDYARWCAAAMAHLTLAARDKVGLVVFDDAHRTKVPPGNGASQRAAILEVLEETEPKGQTKIGEVLSWVASRLSRRGIVAVFSDFFDETESILEGVKRLSFAGHEPILFQILDPQELEFEFDKLTRFVGLENSGIHKIDPKAIREAYIEEIKNHNQKLARQARALSVDCIQVTTADNLESVLSAYLAQRIARSRGGRG